MKKIINADSERKERLCAQTAKRERQLYADAAECLMRKRITIASFITMVFLPLLIDGVLRAVGVWVDTTLAVFYPSLAVTTLQWVLYYLVLLLRAVYQFGGYAVLGYSVMRYGISKSLCPTVLSLVSATVTYLSGMLQTIYTEGIAVIKTNLMYVLPYWVLNYFLALFTSLCLIFLCAMLRIAFLRRGRMQVGISEEPPAVRKQNVLRRLYLWMAGLLFFFTFFPGVMNMIAEVREVGAPEDIWDFITLVEPLIRIILFDLLGYFAMLHIGSMLTKQNETQIDRAFSKTP